MKRLVAAILLAAVFSIPGFSAPKDTLIDDFESLSGWNRINSDKARIDLSTVPGFKGNAVNMHFDFSAGLGYVVMGKEKQIALPENYRFRFKIKGNGLPNTLEFKLMDKDGNTFWKKMPDFVLPAVWTEVVIKKSEISFAWGPNQGISLNNVSKIEIGLSCGPGGKGDLAIDELVMSASEETASKFNIKAEASTFENEGLSPQKAVDNSMSSRWSSSFLDNQWLTLDLGKEEELVGLTIYWETAYAKEYKILLSNDNIKWKEAFATVEGDGEMDDIVFPKMKARYLKIDCVKRGTNYGNSIYEIKLKGKEQEIFLSASSDNGKETAVNALDGKKATAWQSGPAASQWLALDFQKPREIGGIFVYWGSDHAVDYDITGSNDGKNWAKVHSIRDGNGGRDRVFLKSPEFRYIRLEMLKSSGKGYTINEIETVSPENAATPLKFYEILAEERPAGYFPKYLFNKQTYWTLVGVNSDMKEALLNEEGAFEVDSERFSVEPFIYSDGKFLTWGNSAVDQKLEKDYLPIPSVIRKAGKLTLTQTLFADGEPGRSTLVAVYKVTNTSAERAAGKLYVAARPFQVDPPWQCLFSKGGLAKISNISYDGNIVKVDDKSIIPLTRPDNFGAEKQEGGDITKFLSKGVLPALKAVKDEANYASGALEYLFSLAPGESKEYYIAVPFHNAQPEYKPNMPQAEAESFVRAKLDKNIKYWDSKISTFDIKVPGRDMQWINTIKTYLAYILINKDGAATKPGSRSYNRSWIRDGSMTCSSLLKMGMRDEIRTYADWYSQFIFKDGDNRGRVPCNIIGDNTAEGFPENDSNGQFIFLFMQYYNYTKDAEFLKKHADVIISAADFIINQRNQRKTAQYQNTYFYGLVPESASHEGYCDKFMHSYWDDFYALKGMKDAATIMGIIGRKDLQQKYEKEVPDFRDSILRSIQMTMKEHNISFIPGCAEKGDFDATSTSIGIYPCDEYNFLPKKELQATFDKYYDDVSRRPDPSFNWVNYTPYEVRNIRTFIYMDQKERAHAITDAFFADMRPPKWNHWPEVVWRDRDIPRFIGDMPHTWVGADYISSIRSLFVIEDENTNSLILCKGIRDKWLDDPAGVEVRNLPTIWGALNYELKKSGSSVICKVSGEIKVPGKIILASPLAKPIRNVTVDGKAWRDFTEKEITLKKIPSEVTINY